MKLLAFLPCEKVILDSKGIASLINIISAAEVNVPPDFPSNAVSPNEWWIYTMWEASKDEFDIEYMQRLTINWPDGNELTSQTYTFQFGIPERDRPKHSNAMRVIGFPIGQSGDVSLRLWVEREGATVSDIFTYNFAVKHNRIPEAVEAQ